MEPHGDDASTGLTSGKRQSYGAHDSRNSQPVQQDTLNARTLKVQPLACDEQQGHTTSAHAPSPHRHESRSLSSSGRYGTPPAATSHQVDFSPAVHRVPSEILEADAWQFPGWGRTERFQVDPTARIHDSVAPRKKKLAGSSAPTTPDEVYSGQRTLSNPGTPTEQTVGDPLLPFVGSFKHSRRTSHWELDECAQMNESEEHKLGQWTATAISGNDILSSCLYTVGLVTATAGVWAPVSMSIVVMMLYLYRSIYGEVGTALPLNGGAYNALLNSTRKSIASLAAVLTILSYMATAVTSATDALNYLQDVWPEVDVYSGTIALLFFFAVLNLLGISESAVVALIIFVFHVSTLLVLAGFCTRFIAHNGWETLRKNYRQSDTTDVNSIFKALLYGYSAASLGITGFETSANFIEEQKEGVFVKTLRNMWLAVAVFNPMLTFLALSVVELEGPNGIRDGDNQNIVLSLMARKAAGKWLSDWVGIDAFVVLAGSVLTSYVGITGLTRRLAGDRCLPQVLLSQNAWRGTSHFIIFGFFLICTSLFVLVNGNVTSLAGVYTISFLCVMSLFAVGDMLLKYKRDALPRDVYASWPSLLIAVTLVYLSLGVTIYRNTTLLKYFSIYASATALIFAINFNRTRIMKIVLRALRNCLTGSRFAAPVEGRLTRAIRRVNQMSVVFFARTVRLSELNKAILYIRENEETTWVRIVHVAESEDDIPPKFVQNVQIIDAIYPKMRVDAVIVRGEFGPSAIETVARKFGLPRNMLFITCPSKHFKHRMAALGGVRVITHWTPAE